MITAIQYVAAVGAILMAATTVQAETAADSIVPLTTLDLTKMTQGWGTAQIDHAVTGKDLSIGGKAFAHGVGTHARSALWINLAGGTDRFTAWAGVDDHAKPPGSVVFQVYGDGKKLYDSGIRRAGQPAVRVDVDLKGVKMMWLVVTDAGDGIDNDHADWADAQFAVSGATPKAVAYPPEQAVILTPPPPPEPRIHGPRVYGCRPGNPFLYRIPATGDRPMTFSAAPLPVGLSLNANTGIVTGSAPRAGEYDVEIRATNAVGADHRTLRILCGDGLALTPPMGWNDWYAFYGGVTDKTIRQSADLLVSSGMADVGYQYVDIDDCWANSPKNNDPNRVGPLRDAAGNIMPNHYFPDMKALTDYIHSKGLKAGIYTSPGPLTCAGCSGSFGHEAADARQFANWGFDLLKYDWCSYGGTIKGAPDLAAMQKPYRLMGNLLKQQDRDIVFNLCQYGMGNVWEWGEEVGGNSWRTGGDLGGELGNIFGVALHNFGIRASVHPGAWNDPDYIQIGWVNGPCPLSPTEQYSFMSLWSLLAAPLFYSGDISKMDDFTRNVLCNPEVIDIDQDSLGLCGRIVARDGDTFVVVKDLDDGSKAVGLCNGGEVPTTVTASWLDMGLRGQQIVRDVWREKDLGTFDKAYQAQVARHGVVLLRLRPAG